MSPVVWKCLAAGGVSGVLLAAVASLYSPRPVAKHAPPAKPAAATTGMNGDTMQVLTGAREETVDVQQGEKGQWESAIRLATAPIAGEAKPLPPLVSVGDLAPPPPEPAAPPQVAIQVAPAPAPAPAPKPEPKLAAKPAAKPGAFTIGVGPGTSVLRTHVLHQPDRFVIDLAGVTGDLKVPAAAGHIKGIRVGKHDGYTRIVIDSARVIRRGLVIKNGSALEVRLDHAS